MLKRILLGIVLLAVLGVAAYFLTNTETRRIRKQLGAIAEAVSKEEGEGNIAMVYKMQVLGTLLADHVTVRFKDYPYIGETSGTELVSLATRGRTYFKMLSIDIQEAEIDIYAEGKARARCVAKVVSEGHQRYNEKHYFDAELAKTDGKWRFTSFHEDELLKR